MLVFYYTFSVVVQALFVIMLIVSDIDRNQNFKVRILRAIFFKLSN